MPKDLGNFKSNVLTLCHKVKEVVNNNDWPTKEGHQWWVGRTDEDECYISELVRVIEQDLS